MKFLLLLKIFYFSNKTGKPLCFSLTYLKFDGPIQVNVQELNFKYNGITYLCHCEDLDSGKCIHSNLGLNSLYHLLTVPDQAII
jgi:hypothetical protein